MHEGKLLSIYIYINPLFSLGEGGGGGGDSNIYQIIPCVKLYMPSFRSLYRSNGLAGHLVGTNIV